MGGEETKSPESSSPGGSHNGDSSGGASPRHRRAKVGDLVKIVTAANFDASPRTSGRNSQAAAGGGETGVVLSVPQDEAALHVRFPSGEATLGQDNLVVVQARPLMTGDLVKWISDDDEIPDGDIGVVLSFSKDAKFVAQCRFPFGERTFNTETLVLSNHAVEEAVAPPTLFERFFGRAAVVASESRADKQLRLVAYEVRLEAVRLREERAKHKRAFEKRKGSAKRILFKAFGNKEQVAMQSALYRWKENVQKILDRENIRREYLLQLLRTMENLYVGISDEAPSKLSDVSQALTEQDKAALAAVGLDKPVDATPVNGDDGGEDGGTLSTRDDRASLETLEDMGEARMAGEPLGPEQRPQRRPSRPDVVSVSVAVRSAASGEVGEDAELEAEVDQQQETTEPVDEPGLSELDLAAAAAALRADPRRSKSGSTASASTSSSKNPPSWWAPGGGGGGGCGDGGATAAPGGEKEKASSASASVSASATMKNSRAGSRAASRAASRPTSPGGRSGGAGRRATAMSADDVTTGGAGGARSVSAARSRSSSRGGGGAQAKDAGSTPAAPKNRPTPGSRPTSRDKKKAGGRANGGSARSTVDV